MTSPSPLSAVAGFTNDSSTSSASYLAKRRSANHPCPVCGKHYVNEGSLRKHLASHPETTQLTNSLRMWPCSVCQAVFTHENGLLTHMEHMRMDPKHQFAAQYVLSRAAAERREREFVSLALPNSTTNVSAGSATAMDLLIADATGSSVNVGAATAAAAAAAAAAMLPGLSDTMESNSLCPSPSANSECSSNAERLSSSAASDADASSTINIMHNNNNNKNNEHINNNNNSHHNNNNSHNLIHNFKHENSTTTIPPATHTTTTTSSSTAATATTTTATLTTTIATTIVTTTIATTSTTSTTTVVTTSRTISPISTTPIAAASAAKSFKELLLQQSRNRVNEYVSDVGGTAIGNGSALDDVMANRMSLMAAASAAVNTVIGGSCGVDKNGDNAAMQAAVVNLAAAMRMNQQVQNPSNNTNATATDSRGDICGAGSVPNDINVDKSHHQHQQQHNQHHHHHHHSQQQQQHTHQINLQHQQHQRESHQSSNIIMSPSSSSTAPTTVNVPTHPLQHMLRSNLSVVDPLLHGHQQHQQHHHHHHHHPQQQHHQTHSNNVTNTPYAPLHTHHSHHATSTHQHNLQHHLHQHQTQLQQQEQQHQQQQLQNQLQRPHQHQQQQQHQQQSDTTIPIPPPTLPSSHGFETIPIQHLQSQHQIPPTQQHQQQQQLGQQLQHNEALNPLIQQNHTSLHHSLNQSSTSHHQTTTDLTSLATLGVPPAHSPETALRMQQQATAEAILRSHTEAAFRFAAATVAASNNSNNNNSNNNNINNNTNDINTKINLDTQSLSCTTTQELQPQNDQNEIESEQCLNPISGHEATVESNSLSSSHTNNNNNSNTQQQQSTINANNHNNGSITKSSLPTALSNTLLRMQEQRLEQALRLHNDFLNATQAVQQQQQQQNSSTPTELSHLPHST